MSNRMIDNGWQVPSFVSVLPITSNKSFYGNLNVSSSRSIYYAQKIARDHLRVIPCAITTDRPRQSKGSPRFDNIANDRTAKSSSTTTDIPASTEPLFVQGTFANLGLSSSIVSALTSTSITRPTGIQARAIPPILGHADVILGAATGSGKTLAYLLPVIQILKYAEEMRSENDPPVRVTRRPRALILVPTRELAEQVVLVARHLSHIVKFRVVGAIGGGSGMGSIRSLREKLESGPVDILVATTGRLLQLLKAHTIDVRFCSHVVIDEVDTMLDAGFGPELQKILMATTRAGNKAQYIAAGATHPRAAEDIYDAVFPNAKRIDVDLHRAPRGLEQRFIGTNSQTKIHELLPLLRDSQRDNSRVMVFCNTVNSCRFVGHVVDEAGLIATSIHGDVPPSKRDAAYESFQSGQVAILICTDMAARGLDNVNVEHVILFDFPDSAVDYLHRSGRTARAGMSGRVTSFVTRKDQKLAKAIQNASRTRSDALEAARKAREHDEDARRIQREDKLENESFTVSNKEKIGMNERSRQRKGNGMENHGNREGNSKERVRGKAIYRGGKSRRSSNKKVVGW